MMRTGGLIRILRYAGIGQSRNLVDLPSWVPDWTAGLQTFILSHKIQSHNFRASFNAEPRGSIPKTESIVLHLQSEPAASPNAASASCQAVLRFDAVIFDKTLKPLTFSIRYLTTWYTMAYFSEHRKT
jgi:hypothetical protein